jgi:hypothetical protein
VLSALRRRDAFGVDTGEVDMTAADVGYCIVEFCNRRLGSAHLPLCGMHLVFRAHRKKRGFCNCQICERTLYEAARLHIPEHEILKSAEVAKKARNPQMGLLK